MKRLTYRDKDGFPMMKKRGGFKQGGVDRLAAYEDTRLMPEEVSTLVKDWSALCTIVGECGGISRVRELDEADKEGRLFLLPLDPGRSMLYQEYFERPWVMKNVAPCVQYQSSGGIVFYMEYDMFRCEKCHAQIPCYNTYPKAKEAWNRRADDGN